MKTSMHSDEKFRQLSRPQPNGQSLWQHLLHGPETTIIPGVVIAGRAGMAETLGWSLEGFDEAFGEILSLGMAKADWNARLIWLPRGPYHNGPESPNVVIGWGKFWAEVPSCPLKTEVFQGLKGYIQGLSKPYHEAFRKAFAKELGESGTGTGTETGEIPLPEWLDKTAWGEWLEYRKQRKLPVMTEATLKLQLKNLEQYQTQQREIIEASISSGWQGLFPPKTRKAPAREGGARDYRNTSGLPTVGSKHPVVGGK